MSVDFFSINPIKDKALAAGDPVRVGLDLMVMKVSLGEGTVQAFGPDILHIAGKISFLLPMGKIDGQGTFDIKITAAGEAGAGKAGDARVVADVDGTFAGKPEKFVLDSPATLEQEMAGEPILITTEHGTTRLDSRKGRLRLDLKQVSKKVPGLVFIEKAL